MLFGPSSYTPLLCANVHHPRPTPFLLLKAPWTLTILMRPPKGMVRGWDGTPHLKGKALAEPSPGTIWRAVGDPRMKKAHPRQGSRCSQFRAEDTQSHIMEKTGC